MYKADFSTINIGII